MEEDILNIYSWQRIHCKGPLQINRKKTESPIGNGQKIGTFYKRGNTQVERCSALIRKNVKTLMKSNFKSTKLAKIKNCKGVGKVLN